MGLYWNQLLATQTMAGGSDKSRRLRGSVSRKREIRMGRQCLINTDGDQDEDDGDDDGDATTIGRKEGRR